MTTPRRLLAVPLALLAMTAAASASEIRDRAGMFSKEAVRKATAILDRAEEKTRVPTIIETIPTLDGETISNVSLRRAQESRTQGVYVLIARAEHKVEARDAHSFLGADRRKEIETAFTENFSRGKSGLDLGLVRGAETIAEKINEVPRRGTNARPAPSGRGANVQPAPPGRGAGGGGSGLGAFLLIGAVILGAVLLIRLFSRAARPGYGPGMPGGPGPMPSGPGYGPGGYGAPGYGGRGGFWSSMLGGIGGAMAGNWLYDRFSGRHHHDPSIGNPDPTGGTPDPGAGTTDWGGNPGGTSWSDPPDTGGGGDWGGGGGSDWGGGGGDVAGGGDWGGGGGGDWGGGDGGGEWT